MQQAFPGTALPANVVVKAPNVNAPGRARGDRPARAAGARERPRCTSRSRSTSTRTRTVANITIPIDGNGTDRDVERGARGCSATQIVPETVGAAAERRGRRHRARRRSGRTATDELKSNLPPVVAFVLVFAFGLMLVAFRSIVVAAKAIVLNLLSVAAAYGVLVLVFQHGFGKGLLGFSSTAGIDPVVPLLLFVILFGLSMDYHVLILSRIRELFDRGAIDGRGGLARDQVARPASSPARRS